MAMIMPCRGSTEEWEKVNPILHDGEMGIERKNDGTCVTRIGNGKDHYFDLPVISDSGEFPKLSETTAKAERAADTAQEAANNANEVYERLKDTDVSGMDENIKDLGERVKSLESELKDSERFTETEKNKLESIEEGATKTVRYAGTPLGPGVPKPGNSGTFADGAHVHPVQEYFPAIQILSGSDMHTINTPGEYYCDSLSTIKGLKNLPEEVTRPFSLKVLYVAYNEFQQIFTQSASGEHPARVLIKKCVGNVWGDPIELIHESNFESLGIASKNDISILPVKKTSFRYLRDCLRGLYRIDTGVHSDGCHWVSGQIFSKGEDIAKGIMPKANFTPEKNGGGLDVYTNGNTTILDSNRINLTTNPEFEWRWIEVDLGKVRYDIDFIKIYHVFQSPYNYNHKLLVSDDGETWYTLFDSDQQGTYTESETGRTHYLKDSYIESQLTDLKAQISELEETINNNINSMFSSLINDIYKLENKASAIFTRSSAYVIGADSSGETLPLDTIKWVRGPKFDSFDEFELKSGSVVIGPGINTVLISGAVYFHETELDARKQAIITINGTNLIRGDVRAVGNYNIISMPVRTAKVSEGDIITIAVFGRKGDKIDNIAHSCFLSITEI